MTGSDFGDYMLREEDFRVGAPAPKPPPLRSESEIVRNWQGDTALVSVLCATYNHESFIEDAIQGFLAQNTTFPFEVLIRDDASTDSTAEIVRDFEKRYPTIIRGIYEEENRFPAVWPAEVLRIEAAGRFLAFCEGDDHWVDPRKLRTQYDQLSSNPELAMVFHRTLQILDSEIVRVPSNKSETNRDYSPQQVKQGDPLSHLSSRMVVNVEMPKFPLVKEIFSKDKFLESRIGNFGGAQFDGTLLPSVYRRHPGGVWSSLPSDERHIQSAKSYYFIALYHKQRGDYATAEHWRNRGLTHFAYLTEGSFVHVRGWRGILYAVRKISEVVFFFGRDFCRRNLGRVKARRGH